MFDTNNIIEVSKILNLGHSSMTLLIAAIHNFNITASILQSQENFLC